MALALERKLCLWFILIICILRASIVLSLSSSIRYSCYWLLHLLRLSRIDKLLLSCCWIINKNKLGVKSYCSSLRVILLYISFPKFPSIVLHILYILSCCEILLVILFPLLQLMEVWEGEWGSGQEEVLNVRPVLHTRKCAFGNIFFLT